MPELHDPTFADDPTPMRFRRRRLGGVAAAAIMQATMVSPSRGGIMRSRPDLPVVAGTRPFRKRLLGASSVLAAVIIALAACGGGEDGGAGATEAEAVTIRTEIDFTNEPFSGTFSVDAGSEALGCASGTFVDAIVPDGVNKKLTCEEGERQGTFTIFFQPEGEEAGRPWRVESATGAFSGLEGHGDFSVDVNEAETSGVETLIGEISY